MKKIEVKKSDIIGVLVIILIALTILFFFKAGYDAGYEVGKGEAVEMPPTASITPELLTGMIGLFMGLILGIAVCMRE